MNDIVKGLLKLFPEKNITEQYEKIRKIQDFISPSGENEYIKDFVIEKIPVRLFIPEELKSDELILYFHGGGWVIGSVEYFTNACTNIANITGRHVLSVDYRLAPENPYPAGFDDCFNTLKALIEGKTHTKIPRDKIILMGDSAGANFAAAVSLKMRDEDLEKVRAEVLFYPSLYWDHSESSPYPSIKENGYDYGLTISDMEEYFSLYVPNIEDRKSPYVSPLMTEDFSNLPPTLLITSEYDLLRDEGEDYAHKLKNAGNIVRVERIKDAIHGFINFPIKIYPVREALEITRDFLDGLEDKNA